MVKLAILNYFHFLLLLTFVAAVAVAAQIVAVASIPYRHYVAAAEFDVSLLSVFCPSSMEFCPYASQSQMV